MLCVCCVCVRVCVLCVSVCVLCVCLVCAVCVCVEPGVERGVGVGVVNKDSPCSNGKICNLDYFISTSLTPSILYSSAFSW